MTDIQERSTFHSVYWLCLFLVAGFLTLMPGESGLAEESVTDASSTYWGRDALRNDPRIDVRDIVVMTNQGIVHLLGSIESLASKQYADLEAKPGERVRFYFVNIGPNRFSALHPIAEIWDEAWGKG